MLPRASTHHASRAGCGHPVGIQDVSTGVLSGDWKATVPCRPAPTPRRAQGSPRRCRIPGAPWAWVFLGFCPKTGSCPCSAGSTPWAPELAEMQGSGCVAGLDPSPLSWGAEAGAPCGPESCTGGGEAVTSHAGVGGRWPPALVSPAASRATRVMVSGLCQGSVSLASLLEGHSLTSRAGPPAMSMTGDLELVASSMDCRWASWTVSQPLLGQSSAQHLSSVLCGFPLGSVQRTPKGKSGARPVLDRGLG